MNSLKEEVRQLKLALASRNMEEDKMEPEDEEDEEDNKWNQVLGAALKRPTHPDAKYLSELLGSPPPLDSITKGKPQIDKWAGVPQTPKARRDPRDKKLWVAQDKLEMGLHLTVQFAETKDMTALAIASAYFRSSWEDLQQGRRQLIAGKQSRKLEPRADDTTPKLLSKEEEKQIFKPRFNQPPWKPQGQATSQPTNWYGWQNQNKWKGPGKGKGKGKGFSSSKQE